MHTEAGFNIGITLAGDTIDAVSRIAQEATAQGPSRCAVKLAGMVPGMGDGLRSAPSGDPRKPSSARVGAGRLVVTGSFRTERQLSGQVSAGL